jgi:hypothetical protein
MPLSYVTSQPEPSQPNRLFPLQDQIDFKEVFAKSEKFLDSHCVWVLAQQLLHSRRMKPLENLFATVCDAAGTANGLPIEAHHVCSMILNHLADLPGYSDDGMMERMYTMLNDPKRVVDIGICPIDAHIAMMKSHALNGKIDKAYQIFLRASPEDTRPALYNQMITFFVLAGDEKMAVQVHDMLKARADVVPNMATELALLRLALLRKEYRKIVKFYQREWPVSSLPSFIPPFFLLSFF